ncbi:uncharacterized protein LOC118342352 isoform X1 [Morone saxatilis]|uniref:uncharacterized protein LOC118342352 isoform X1 n=1 Tax=Morone saxatilis TaxID=34816 RepID=UPI0015E1E9AD|nr:uncharacterized protein LOC118342352 isoform X1 [Morone saxatilis]
MWSGLTGTGASTRPTRTPNATSCCPTAASSSCSSMSPTAESITATSSWWPSCRCSQVVTSGVCRPDAAAPLQQLLKHRQRWFYRRREREKWELIFTVFRNGTVKPERGGGGSATTAKLQIQDLQPEDAGEYQCKVKLVSKVTRLTVQPEPTSTEQTAWTTTTTTITTTTTAAVTKTDEAERKKEKKQRPENGRSLSPAVSHLHIHTTDVDECLLTRCSVRGLSALLIVAVTGLGLMVLLLVAVCVLLTGMKCRRRRKRHRRTASQRQEDTELQPWKTSSRQTDCEVYESPSLPEETIHYASLGRQNWKERPSRTPPDENHHNVIYSSVVTRPNRLQQKL